MEIAHAKAQALQTLAFRAQRSVEIYTLEDQERNIRLDAGMISPDNSRAFYEGEITEGKLAGLLMESWRGILDPLGMQLDYVSFFDSRPDWDTLRLSFKDASELEEMRKTKSFSFRVDAAKMPAGRFDTKIKNVLVALVGAASRSGEISCTVRHGGQYAQRRKDNTITVQRLEPRSISRSPKTVRLDRPIENLDPPLDAPTSLAIWGRGIGGDWEVKIEPHEIESGSLDLAGLTEIQVWIDYQYVR